MHTDLMLFGLLSGNTPHACLHAGLFTSRLPHRLAAIAKSSDLNLAPLPFSVPIPPLSGSILRPLKQQGGSQVLGLIFATRLNLKRVFCCCCSNFSVLMASFGNGLFLSGSAHLEKAGSRSLCIFTSQEATWEIHPVQSRQLLLTAPHDEKCRDFLYLLYCPC